MGRRVIATVGPVRSERSYCWEARTPNSVEQNCGEMLSRTAVDIRAMLQSVFNRCSTEFIVLILSELPNSRKTRICNRMALCILVHTVHTGALHTGWCNGAMVHTEAKPNTQNSKTHSLSKNHIDSFKPILKYL